MRMLAFALSACALVVALSASASDAPLDPTTSRTWTLSDVSPGQRLDVRLESGAGLRITTWDRNEVSVVSDLSEKRCPDARISLTRSADGVRLESVYPDGDGSGNHNCSLTIEVRVPKRFDVKLQSAGGSVEIRNLEGSVSGFTGGGQLAVRRMHGDIQLRTGGGSVHVSDSDLEGQLSTGGGGISFDNVSGPVTATSGSKPGVVRGRSRST